MKLIKPALMISILGFSVASAQAAPVQWSIADGGNGHYYDVIDMNTDTWENYNALASSSSHMGMQGHLATVTSSAENAWLVVTFGASNLNYHLFGGTDMNSEGNWEWVTGEAWSYTNWGGGEPNNCCGGEDYLQFWNNNGQWNDIYNNYSNTNGYVVEYSVAAVPEPSTYALMLAGLGLVGWMASRRRQSI